MITPTAASSRNPRNPCPLTRLLCPFIPLLSTPLRIFSPLSFLHPQFYRLPLVYLLCRATPSPLLFLFFVCCHADELRRSHDSVQRCHDYNTQPCSDENFHLFLKSHPAPRHVQREGLSTVSRSRFVEPAAEDTKVVHESMVNFTNDLPQYGAADGVGQLDRGHVLS